MRAAAEGMVLMRSMLVHGMAQPLHASMPSTSRAFAAAAVNQMALIKQLRERSGAPISDVKSCLEKNDWDLDKAYDALRKKGLAAAAKKASRHASDGLVALAKAGDNAAAIVEVNSETDFVARNELFQKMVGQVAAAATGLEPKSGSHELDLEQLQAARVAGGASVSDACAEVAAQVRENIRLRRGFKIRADHGQLFSYLHQSAAPGLARIASVVVLEAVDGSPLSGAPQVQELGQQLAMHAAGMRPQYLDRASVPPAAVERERALLREQAAGSGKPEAVVAKMVEGRLGKFYEESCLLEQRFFLDESVKVQGAVDRVGKAVNQKLRLAAFLRVQVGEGLEAQKADFAAEVEAIVKGN